MKLNLVKSLISSFLVLAGASSSLAATFYFSGPNAEVRPSQYGQGVAGQDVVINYASERLQECTANNRSSQSFLQIEYRIDGGDIETANIQSGQIIIATPQGAENLEFWFHNFTIGTIQCDAYDSNNGANYNLSLAPALTFADNLDQDPTPSDRLVAGKPIVIEYAGKRLRECTAQNRLAQSFRVMFYSFDGGEVKSKGIGFGDIQTTIQTPQGSSNLELWFHNYTIGSFTCDAWDSKFGANYQISLN